MCVLLPGFAGEAIIISQFRCGARTHIVLSHNLNIVRELTRTRLLPFRGLLRSCGNASTHVYVVFVL